MKVVQKLTEDPTIYLANSMNSLRVEGQKTIAYEIVQQFDWEVPEWLLVPGGNLGNVSAIYKGFKEMYDMGIVDSIPRLVCCQTENANPFYMSFSKAMREERDMTFDDYESVTAQSTLASAIQIGAPVSYPKAFKAIRDSNGLVVQCSEQELANAVAIADKTGMFNCPHTGVALACLMNLVKENTIKGNERVVVISTAHGLKFTDFKANYHDDKIKEFSGDYQNKPVAFGSDPDDVAGNLIKHLDDMKSR
jgi:threonine synthase